MNHAVILSNRRRKEVGERRGSLFTNKFYGVVFKYLVLNKQNSFTRSDITEYINESTWSNVLKQKLKDRGLIDYKAGSKGGRQIIEFDRAKFFFILYEEFRAFLKKDISGSLRKEIAALFKQAVRDRIIISSREGRREKKSSFIELYLDLWEGDVDFDRYNKIISLSGVGMQEELDNIMDKLKVDDANAISGVINRYFEQSLRLMHENFSIHDVFYKILEIMGADYELDKKEEYYLAWVYNKIIKNNRRLNGNSIS